MRQSFVTFIGRRVRRDTSSSVAWEGTGACASLEECDANVWTINLPAGELVDGEPVYCSSPETVPEGASPLRYRNGIYAYQTDAGAFIGHRYRAAGFAHRVTQIYCDSREWDASAVLPGFFETALVDGGHTEDVVLSDTEKALAVVRPNGIILWHDFCPDPSVFGPMSSVVGVVAALTRAWPDVARSAPRRVLDPTQFSVGGGSEVATRSLRACGRLGTMA